jgi:transcriptional regulator with XRE-family HTH domain
VPGFFVFSPAKFRAARERDDLSREQLAVASRLSFQTIASLEYGYRQPSKAALLRLATALGVSPGDLLEEDLDLEAVAR